MVCVSSGINIDFMAGNGWWPMVVDWQSSRAALLFAKCDRDESINQSINVRHTHFDTFILPTLPMLVMPMR